MNLNKTKSFTLKDYRKKEINLLPSDFHKVSKVKLYTTFVVFLCVIAVGVFAYYEYTIFKETSDFKDEIMVKQAAINANNQKIENQNLIINLGNRIELKEILLSFIFSTNRSIVDILDTFEASLNGEIYLASLNANSTDAFTISSSSTSNEAISLLINRLKLLKTVDGDKYFSSVFVNGITRTEDEEGNVLYLFQLNCQFEGGIVDETE